MKKYIEIQLDDNEKIYIEACDTNEKDYGMENASNAVKDTIPKKGKEFLDNSLDTIAKYSKKVMEKLKSTEYNLDEIEVEFSVGFDGKANVVISSVESNFGMNIKLKWKNK